MKKLFIIFCIGIILNTNGQSTFEKAYNLATPGSFSNGQSVQQTSDNGYIIAAGGYDNVNYYDHSYLIKTDAYGNKLWQRNYSAMEMGSGKWTLETKEGYYMLLSEEPTTYPNPLDINLRKFNTSGSLIWAKNYFSNNDTIGNHWKYNYAEYLNQTSDSGFVIIGCKTNKIFVIKTNKIGDTIWTKILLNTVSTSGYCIRQTSDNGYIISTGADVNSNTMYMIKLNSTGNIVWSKSFINASVQHGNSIEITSDSNYIIAGGKINTQKLFLIKMNKYGDTLWTKTYQLPPANSIRIINDSTYLIISNVSLNASTNHIMLIKIDTDGILKDSMTLWSRFSNCISSCLSLTNDNRCCFVGEVDSTMLSRNLYFVKTNYLNFSSSIKSFYWDEILLYPNPATQNLTIECPEQSIIEILNIEGQKIKSITANKSNTTLDISSFAIGMYFIKVKAEKGVAVKKFIKE